MSVDEAREKFIDEKYKLYSDQRLVQNLSEEQWIIIFMDIVTLQDLINYKRFQYHPLDDIERELQSLIRRIGNNETFLFKIDDIDILKSFVTDPYKKNHSLLEEAIPFTLEDFYNGRIERREELDLEDVEQRQPAPAPSPISSPIQQKLQEQEQKQSPYEEDSQEYSDIISSDDSILHENSDDKNKNVSICSNESPILLMPYESSDYDDLLIIYMENKSKKFETATCITKDELRSFIKSDIDTDIPNNIMTIYTKPKLERDFLTGMGGKPTGRIVIRLPQNQIYVTGGSVKRMLNSNIKKWYALPLFEGKRRRVGNLRGIFGSSMNHGQIPGFIIYKLYTKDEIKSGVKVEETADDYPMTFAVEQFKTIFDIFNETDITGPKGIDMFQHFINTIIETITK